MSNLGEMAARRVLKETTRAKGASALRQTVRATKFRVHKWVNVEKRKPVFGIQGCVNGVWMHCSEDGQPIFFDTIGEARIKVRELNRGEGEGVLKLPKVI